ncbi:hypothetical protein [uncultured Winogradskyella sp.]|uniref:DUF7832 domain-containing protein n=1 Tax=uncultured Winogradskyella sp. TaxID=395353 RepID=UPI002606C9A1|nr:hypothetical protein [uncultured Winogradskyella sp.]
MAKYDDVSWHYGGDFPKDLSKKNGATHTGMFIKWCIDNNLFSEELEDDAKEEIRQLKDREITGAEFLINVCDEKFTDNDLNELGNEFAQDYYEDDTTFGAKNGCYGENYCDLFNEKAEKQGFEYESIYHIEDTYKNYDFLKPIIDKRFEEWKKYKRK